MNKLEKYQADLEPEYATALNRVVDNLFQEAFDKQWTWSEIAEESGLAYSTVVKLGNRETKYPQLRTVQLIANALGGKVEFTPGKFGRKRSVSWTPKVFAA